MKLIKTKFVLYPQKDKNGAGHACGKAGDIDNRIGFLSEQIPGGDYYIVFKHDSLIILEFKIRIGKIFRNLESKSAIEFTHTATRYCVPQTARDRHFMILFVFKRFNWIGSRRFN